MVVAERLSGAIRSGDLLARLAGDEFVVLARDLVGGAELDQLASRLAGAFADPVQLGDSAVPVRASIGTTLFTAGQHSEEVLHRADTAMYEAKREAAHSRLLTGVPVPRSVVS